MSKAFHKALMTETWRHWVFPHLLHYREEKDSWVHMAKRLNEDGIRTYSGVPWTRQYVQKLFLSYWKERNGRYSWNEHGYQLEALARILGVLPPQETEAKAPTAPATTATAA